ncbi:hypothetical protein TRICHSKD4_4187 [Roseibium sp. TrichSKD4]|uniref:hypothetical protein n=1 Tax=Roseibium sp. TrichSKD4 TaxID=744980 RepID=UPI0001E56901|nr:hypothetical protein [Roseibium sp. TrichSKD4]EFO30592.1 hypothetical protein TRICHSKD4_4187 [Roseibium sp. TrichSKD4]
MNFQKDQADIGGGSTGRGLAGRATRTKVGSSADFMAFKVMLGASERARQKAGQSFAEPSAV